MNVLLSHFNRNDTHFALSSVITEDVLTWDFLLCKTVYDNVIYTFKYRCESKSKLHYY